MRKKVKLGKEIKALDHMLMRNLFCQARKLGLDEITVMHGWIIDYLYQNQDRAVFQKDVEKEFSIFILKENIPNKSYTLQEFTHRL